MTPVPQLGDRVGAGAMSEVFAWDEGRVVKLFLPAYDHMVERELQCTEAVNRAGVASPVPHGLTVLIDRRPDDLADPTLRELAGSRSPP
jgi:hypothetical protein